MKAEVRTINEGKLLKKKSDHTQTPTKADIICHNSEWPACRGVSTGIPMGWMS